MSSHTTVYVCNMLSVSGEQLHNMLRKSRKWMLTHWTQRPSCLSQMKWPALPLVMPTGGGKDSRMVRSSSSPSLTCQWTCPQTTTAKTGQKRATGQNGPKSCYRQLGLLDNDTGHNSSAETLRETVYFLALCRQDVVIEIISETI